MSTMALKTQVLGIAAVFLMILISAASPCALASDKGCADFTYQQDAQNYFNSYGGSPTNNVDNLDGEDGDGVVCEALPRSISSTATPAYGVKAKGDGPPRGWIVVILVAVGVGGRYYKKEIHGPENVKAPRPDNLPYNTKAMLYEEYLRTPERAATRQMALDRDGNKCVKCSSVERLQVHHLAYSRRGNERLKDLQTLCHRCNQAMHPDKLRLN